MNYASIVPLIGGETLGMQNAFKKRPDYILSYEAFGNNDRHLLEYYKGEVEYGILDSNTVSSVHSVDVVNTVCPCAGLSTLSPKPHADNPANDWMSETANYVLDFIGPKVFWGENSPQLASSMGRPVVEQLKQIANKFGYTLSIYKTKSLIHGLPQIRMRTFYFFWKGDKIPLLDYINRPHEKLEDLIRNTKVDKNDPMSTTLTNKKTPTDDPLYRWILEELHGGITHQQFQQKIVKSVNTLDYFLENKIPFSTPVNWLRKKGFESQAQACERRHEKISNNLKIMRRSLTVPKDYIGAFVGHLPTMLTHPDEDRFLTIREAMNIMKLPEDMQLLDYKKNLNHICQNVPVTTATDMANGVKKFLKNELPLVDSKFLIQDNIKRKIVEMEKDVVQLDRFMV